MAGDSTNAALWTNADVYIGPTTGLTYPTDVSTAWATVDADWKAVGLLDGESGFTETREDADSSEHYAWGGLLVKATKSKHKRTVKFVALEDNATVFALINPGSTRSTSGGLTTSAIKAPEAAEFAIGFEVRDGDVVKRRWCKRAEVVEVGEVKESEGELTVFEITVVMYPDASTGVIYDELKGSVA